MKKEHIKSILSSYKFLNPTILEIGCNDGSDTIEFLNCFKEFMIYCFEPDFRAVSKFKNNINDDRCKLYEFALSDSDGNDVFYMSDSKVKGFENWDKSGSIIKPKYHYRYHPWCKFEQTVNIKTKKLDTWYKENNLDKIHFAWMDVQGAEEKVIKGGVETFKKIKFLYTEYSDNQLYDSDSSIRNIKKLLPSFKHLTTLENNILLENTKF